MEHKIISPLGNRIGYGSFDCFFDEKKYNDFEEADKANDLVIVDFVEEIKTGTIYFSAYHKRTPDVKKMLRLERQHFPAGIDVQDDKNGWDLARTLFL